MHSLTLRLCSFLMCLLFANTAISGLWWTGPLLAPSGHTIPRGHSNLETYVFDTKVKGTYNSFGKVTHVPGDKNYVANPLFSHGLTDSMDMQLSIPYAYNINNGAHSNGLSDTSVTLGFQLLEQKQSSWRPDLRLTIGEIIPTGQFEHLDPANNGTDSTGLGSYQTPINLNFQQLFHVYYHHYLRSRLSLGYVFAKKVPIEGISSYGGSRTTFGEIKPGNMMTADLAGEFNLTQRLVMVLEGFGSIRHASSFKGYAGSNDSIPGHPLSRQLTLAPAIEYNINENIGIIAGPWFTIRGRDSSEFSSAVVALNAYW